jgi:hypothetical protein
MCLLKFSKKNQKFGISKKSKNAKKIKKSKN